MLKRANEHEENWKNKVEEYSKAYPELAEEFKLAISGKLPQNYEKELPKFDADHNAASRADSGEVIQALSKHVPSFFGGSADLAGSNKSNVKDAKDYDKDNRDGKTFGLVFVNLVWVQLLTVWQLTVDYIHTEQHSSFSVTT